MDRVVIEIEFFRILGILIPSLESVALTEYLGGNDIMSTDDTVDLGDGDATYTRIKGNAIAVDHVKIDLAADRSGRYGHLQVRAALCRGGNRQYPIAIDRSRLRIIDGKGLAVFVGHLGKHIKGNLKDVTRLDLKRFPGLILPVLTHYDVLDIGGRHGRRDRIGITKLLIGFTPIFREMLIELRIPLGSTGHIKIKKVPYRIQRIGVLDPDDHRIGIKGFLPFIVIVVQRAFAIDTKGAATGTYDLFIDLDAVFLGLLTVSISILKAQLASGTDRGLFAVCRLYVALERAGNVGILLLGNGIKIAVHRIIHTDVSAHGNARQKMRAVL